MQPKNQLPPWLRPKVAAPALKLAVAWYAADDWLKVKTAAMDPDRFEATYGEWCAMAEAACADLRAAGLRPEKTPVKADDLLAWCLAHDKVNDAANRSEYVAGLGKPEPG